MPDGPVAIVGGGPAGLAAAVELRRLGVGEVVVIEREADAGGIPRHARHQGFGLRDLRRPLSGPAYARRHVELARAAGAELLLETMATGWSEAGALELTGPGGRSALQPAATVLATGCRERPRSARLVPGSRPDGVMTTGMLQQLVYLQGLPAGRRALIVGAEHVSFSAIVTLAHGGARTVALATELPRHQSVAAFRLGALARVSGAGVDAHARERDPRAPARGGGGADRRRGRAQRGPSPATPWCSRDDWIPDHELAVLAGLELDPGTRGPAVDSVLRASSPGVFAAGNVLHGAEQADVAALSGRHAAAGVARYLRDGEWPKRRVPIVCEPPLGWIAPNAVAGAQAPPRQRFALRSHEFLRAPRIQIAQDDRVLWSGRLPRVMPGRSVRLPHAWVAEVDPAGGAVVCALRRFG